MEPIRKAVFPVAGLGTRFLPATKAMPKEMLPIIDKPLIQYTVEEAVQAGVTEIIFVTGRHKRAIEDHFDRFRELETELEAKNKMEMLDAVRHVLPDHVKCIYVRQPAPLGLGHAVLCAAPVVGDEPFAVILADDLIDAKRPVIRQLMDVAYQHDGSVLGIQEIPIEATEKYGIISGAKLDAACYAVNDIVEKPAPAVAPSNLGVVGRYILEPEVFSCLRNTKAGIGGEIQLTDAIKMLMQKKRVFGYCYEGIRYDCGSKTGFHAAIRDYGEKYHGLKIVREGD